MQIQPDIVLLAAIAIVGLLLIAMLVAVCLLLFRPWLRILLSGGRGSIIQLLGMRLRGNPVTLIIDAYLTLLHSGKSYSLTEVETCFVVHRSKVSDSGQLASLVGATVAKRDTDIANSKRNDR